jgi:hypothetical protein
MLKSLSSKSRDLFGGKGIFNPNPQYWKSWYGSEFADWISVSNHPDLLTLLGDQSNLTYYIQDLDPTSFVNPYSGDIEIPSEIKQYFNDSLMNYLLGNTILYRPGLVTEDVWKYDLSGETEYGLVTPPTDSEHEFFDRNFSLQFTVYARNQRSCNDMGYKCINPKGIVGSASGCTFDPYCDCPALDKIPSETEPTYLELYRLHQTISECSLIEEHLGAEWLGCEWSDPESSCSCNCPEQGSKFADYLAYTRTYATFWETDYKVPLLRQAQIGLMNAQKMKITVGNNDKVKIGYPIEVFVENVPDLKNKFKAISGKWLVTGIQHRFPSLRNYIMTLDLARDSVDYDINEISLPESISNQQVSDQI